MAPIGAQAADDAKCPDWKGAWARFVVRELGGQPSFDQTKPWGFGQQAPLTEEYKKVLEASLADQAKGGQGDFAGHALCLPAGMPLMMIAFRPLEFIVTPETTYIPDRGLGPLSSHLHRRTRLAQGRRGDFFRLSRSANGSTRTATAATTCSKSKPAVRSKVLAPTTPAACRWPSTTSPSSRSASTADKADPKILHDQITVIDHALTRPWTVDKKYLLEQTSRLEWDGAPAARTAAYIAIGKDNYYMSGDGMLMPARRGRPPPDLRYFKQSQK